MNSQVSDLDNSSLNFLRTSNLIGFVRMQSNGVFVEANDAYLDLVGYSREELIGKMTWRDITPPEFFDISTQTHRSVLHAGTAKPIEKDYIRKDGKRITVLIGSVRAGNGDDVVGFILDITQRKANERALDETYALLRQSEEKFRLAVLQCPDIMYYMDADLRYTWISKVPPPMRPEDVVGKTDFDFPPRDQAERLVAAKRQVMQTRKGMRVQGRTLINGELHYFESALEPRIQDGKVIGVAGYFRDMTAWRQKELELSQANASLEQMRQTLEQRVTERTAELARSESLLRESEEHYRQVAEHNQRLVRDVEHRVRNHLSGLVGLVHVMRENATSVQSFADAIESRLRAMVHVHQMLAAAGWDAVGLQSLIESTLASLSYVTPHACDIAIAGPALAVNPQQALPLALIMAEWFTNSCKYGSCGVPGGRLRVAWTITNNATPASESPAAPPRDNSQITLTWTESAGPPIPPQITPSVGTALVHGFATRELQGECELRYPPEGVAHTLRFPLEG
jgi:PAS domain S-box-containing protein